MSHTPNERRVLALTSVAHPLTHLYMLVFPATLLPLVRDTGRPFADVLGYSFAGYLLFGLGALPAGWITDRWCARGMLAVNLIGCGTMSVLCGLAPSLPWLGVAYAGLGLFASVYHPAGTSLLTRTMRRRGAALGLHGMAGNLGLAVAPFLAGVLATTLGWRAAWIVLGLPAIALGVVVALADVDERDVDEPAAGAPAGGGLRLVFAFALLCAAMVMGGLAFEAVSAILRASLEARVSFLDAAFAPLERYAPGGTGTLAATALASAVFLVGIAGQALGGFVAERVDLRAAYVLMPLCAVPFAAMASTLGEGWLVVGAAGYVTFGLGVQPVENSLVARLTPPRLRASAYGTKFVLSFGVGSAAVPAVAALERAFGLPSAFVAVAAAMAVGSAFAVALFWLTRRVW